MLNAMHTLVDPRIAEHPPDSVRDADALVAGRYRLLHPLGEGGMGHVYLASDQLLTRQVAIKTIRPELSGNEEVRARIRRECRMHAALGVHPNIVALYDTVEENGQIYLIMEYVAGTTLARHVADAGSVGFPPDQALEIIRQVLLALASIHGQGIVHRDIKTANVLLQQQADGRYRAKLTDFGIARAELEASAMTRLTALDVQGPGTPVYMAPERIDPQSFGDVGPASDLYAVGIILFELLTGQPPFRGSMTEIFNGHLVQPVDLTRLPAHLPPQFAALLATALAKHAHDRFASAETMMAALAGLDTTVTAAEADALPGPPCPSVEEATLLAPQGEPKAMAAEATILNPARSQGRQFTTLWSRPWPWLAAATLAVLLLLGSLLASHRPPPSLNGSSPDTAAVAQNGQQNVSPQPAAAAPSDNPAATENPTALETLEQVRQQRQVEAMAAADRTGSAPASEWQVIEDRSRRIR
jgi:serine/threonine-protein kinase